MGRQARDCWNASLGALPGYAVKVYTRNVAAVDPAVVTEIEKTATSNGLTPVVLAFRNTSAPGNKLLTSVYERRLSVDRYNIIRMNIIYSDQQSVRQELFIVVEHPLRANQEIKRQIDPIAIECLQSMIKAFGVSNVGIETGGSAPTAW